MAKQTRPGRRKVSNEALDWALTQKQVVENNKDSVGRPYSEVRKEAEEKGLVKPRLYGDRRLEEIAAEEISKCSLILAGAGLGLLAVAGFLYLWLN